MLNVDIIVEELLADIETEVQFILVNKGVPRGSDLVRDLKVEYKNDAVKIIAYDYYEFLDKGRKARIKKVPIQAIIKWIKKSSRVLMSVRSGSINKAAFAIQTAIYKNGIKPRNYSKEVNETITTMLEENLLNSLSNNLLEEFENTFNI